MDYLHHYEREFLSLRETALTLLEIGIAGGSSLKMWREFFKCATIVGVDINPICKRYEAERVTVEIGSQVNADFLDRLSAKYAPTIVIDDGSHRADHIQLTFEHLYPGLPPGGCYVIEDFHFHHSRPTPEQWRGPGKVGADEFVSSLAARLQGAERAPAPASEIERMFLKRAERVVILPRAAVIWNKPVPPPIGEDIARLEADIESSNRYIDWRRLADWILDRRGPLDSAERAARKSIAADQRRWDAHNCLSRVLEASGKIDQAISSAQTAIQLADDARLRQKLVIRAERLGKILAAGAAKSQ